MRGPVKFESTLSPWNSLSIQIYVHFFGYLVVGKLDKAIADGCSFDLVSDQFYRLNLRDSLEQVHDIVLIHPRFNVTNPQRLCSYLRGLGVGEPMLSLSGGHLLKTDNGPH